MSGVHWVTEPHQSLPLKIGTSGFASVPATTVIDVLKSTVQKHGNRPAMALKRPVNGKIPDAWQIWTWQNYYDDCTKFAKCLVALGVPPYGIVNILGFNSPEWFISNTGAILGANISAGIYSTNTAEACLYITNHSRAEVVVLEDNKQLAKYASSTCPSCVKALVMYGETPNPEIVAKCSATVYTWADFMKIGNDVPQSALEDRLNHITAGHCATLIYTSGTTGPPKAVMISHDNITWTARNMGDSYFPFNHEERICSYLPLSHIAAQLLDIHLPLYLGACSYFCQADALKGSLTVTLREVKPTAFFGVPRVWEKMQEKMVQIGRGSTGIKAFIASTAKAIGTEKTKLSQYGAAGGSPWGYGCAKAIVFSKIREALGLDKCKACFTAAAPIAPETLWYFGSLDIPVFEVFGQSECTGPHTVSSPGVWKIGTCGRPMLGTESKLVKENGELCYRGRHIFMGYMYMPDKTAETIDDEGWLHSGDVSEFDNDTDPRITGPSGFMRITGRIKELIITAGGENVPPVLIENEMKAAMNALSNCMVIGDKRKFLSMLISLKVEVDLETGVPTNRLASDSLFVGRNIGSSATTVEEAANDPLWVKYLNDGMKVANSKTTSSAQIVQKWKLLPTDFSEKAGDLTPTLKLKRNVVTEKYAALIESIYEE